MRVSRPRSLACTALLSCLLLAACSNPTSTNSSSSGPASLSSSDKGACAKLMPVIFDAAKEEALANKADNSSKIDEGTKAVSKYTADLGTFGSIAQQEVASTDGTLRQELQAVADERRLLAQEAMTGSFKQFVTNIATLLKKIQPVTVTCVGNSGG